MGGACDKIQSQQKELEEMKAAIKQLQELMEQTKGAQETLKNGLQDITNTTTEVVDKYKSIITKVDGFEQSIKQFIITTIVYQKQLEENIKKTIEQTAKQGVQGAMKNFF